MTDTVTNAVARVETGAHAMVARYSDDFNSVLPSHINKPTWIRLAQGALKKGKRVADGRTELEVAAASNPGVFLAELLTAARLGLEPGTEQFYLTPRKVKGQPQILGIVGYQGYIELMYRAGAISSVVAEVVYSNDRFSFRPGVDETPLHEIDWDSDDRGQLRLVYAFARMKDGATSKVVVLNRAAIQRIKASAQGAEYPDSPWQKHEPSMWLKSAVRQLAKWVPTSAEYIREQLRAARDVAAEGPTPPPPGDQPAAQDVTHLPEAEVVDAELVDEDPELAAYERARAAEEDTKTEAGQ